MKRIRRIFCLLLITFMLSGCFFKRDTMEDIDIYTTVYPINYLVNCLYGNNSTIHSIYPTGVNINEYTISDKKLEEYSNKDIPSSDLDMKSIQGAFKNAWKDTSLWKF